MLVRNLYEFIRKLIIWKCNYLTQAFKMTTQKFTKPKPKWSSKIINSKLMTISWFASSRKTPTTGTKFNSPAKPTCPFSINASSSATTSNNMSETKLSEGKEVLPSGSEASSVMNFSNTFFSSSTKTKLSLLFLRKKSTRFMKLFASLFKWSSKRNLRWTSCIATKRWKWEGIISTGTGRKWLRSLGPKIPLCCSNLKGRARKLFSNEFLFNNFLDLDFC